MTFLCGILWGTYLSLGPVYWLPYIGEDMLGIIKAVLIGLCVISSVVLAIQKNELSFPKGQFGIIGYVAIVFISVPGFFQAGDIDIVIRRFMDINYGFITLWSIYLYYICTGGKTFPFTFACSILSLLCILIISSSLAHMPDWRPPAIFKNYHLSDAGFGALRTGWSNGISFFTVAMFFSAIKIKLTTTNKQYFKSGFKALTIVGAQLVVAGRAGLLASITGMFIVFWKSAPKMAKYTMPVLVLAALIAVVVEGNLDKHLRLNRLETGKNSELSMDKLDHFSAGRITTYMYGIDKWLESPLFGHGFGQVDVIKGHEIHNLWLRLLAEAGPALPIFFFLGIVNIIRHAIKVTKNTQIEDKQEQTKLIILSVIVLQGLLISFLEPRMLLGSFQNCAIWWAACGAALASTQKLKNAQNNK